MAQEFTLGEFMKCLVALLHERGVAMPLMDDRPWHLLLYKLQQDPAACSDMGFLETIDFDWDGPFPKCRQLSDLLHAVVSWAGNVSSFDSRGTISLAEPVAMYWRDRHNGLQARQKTAVQRALNQALSGFHGGRDGHADQQDGREP
jgi:hypothetical protein